MSSDSENLPGMIGEHAAMREVYRLARLAARAELSVVIVGETGSGKELVARALHELSVARAGPFVDVNCAAIPEGLAEGHFFGWERGAFTGAVTQTLGLLEQAHGGTLFLDEACSLALWLQAKLLRAIEGKAVRPLGAQGRRTAAFRLVLAVAEEPEMLVTAGRWRADFAFRVSGIVIRVPPLRERCTDIPLLARQFLASGQDGRGFRHLEAEALRLLQRYPWPGNVRELKTLIERLAALVEEVEIGAPQLLRYLPGLGAHLEEGRRLELVLAAVDWNVSQAARALGMTRANLHLRLRKRGLVRPQRSQQEVSSLDRPSVKS